MQTETREPAVRAFEPTAGFRTMTRIANLFMRPLLRSSAGKGLHELALLSFEGRRTGKHYEVPVGYHELDGEPLILTASTWKANLRGGADVELVHEARRTPMRAELIEGPEEVARVYEAFLQRDGLEEAKATRIGLEVKGDRIPSCEEIAAGVGGRRTVVKLRPR